MSHKLGNPVNERVGKHLGINDNVLRLDVNFFHLPGDYSLCESFNLRLGVLWLDVKFIMSNL